MRKGIVIAAVAVAASMTIGDIAKADDAYVTGSAKLIIIDNPTAGKQKLVYLSKDKADADGDGLLAHKGGATPDGAPSSGVTGSVDIFYRNDGGNRAVFDLPEANWVTNNSNVAKYVNKSAPAGGGVKVGVVKHSANLVKIVSKTLGDSSSIDLFAGGDPGPDGLAALVTINNANDPSVHRLCTIFSSGSPVIKEIAAGTGRKLVVKSPVKTGVDFSDCVNPIGSPSGAFVD